MIVLIENIVDLTPFVPLSLKGEGEGEVLPHALYKTRQTPYTKFESVKKEVSKVAQERPWTECEFTALLYRPELDHESLAQIIGRRPGAIGVVREGVHRFHMGKENHGILAQMMVRLLEDKNRLHTQCWKCKEWF